MVLGQLDIHMQKLDLYLTPYTKINWKLIIDLNVRAKDIFLKTLEESILNFRDSDFVKHYLQREWST